MTDLQTKNKYVGLKQSLPAIEQGAVLRTFVAQDAEPSLKNRIIAQCTAHRVPIEYVETMAALGKACGIDVGAAVAVILKNERA